MLGTNLGRNTQSCGCLRKELTAVRARKPLVDVIVKQNYTYYKRNALNRSISWEIDRKFFKELIFSPCFYCGIVAGNVTKTTRSSKGGAQRELPNNGVDRFDNHLGYTEENSVPCCKNCNFAKHTFSFEEFKEWAVRLAANLKGKNV